MGRLLRDMGLEVYAPEDPPESCWADPPDDEEDVIPTPEPPPVDLADLPLHTLALCEAERLVLHPGHLYIFEAVGDCTRCAELAAAAEGV